MLFRRKTKRTATTTAQTSMFDSEERYFSDDVSAEMAGSEELTSFIWDAVKEHLNGNWGLLNEYERKMMFLRLQNHQQVESLFEIPNELGSSLTGIRIVTDSRRRCTSVWAYTILRAAA